MRERWMLVCTFERVSMVSSLDLLPEKIVVNLFYHIKPTSIFHSKGKITDDLIQMVQSSVDGN